MKGFGCSCFGIGGNNGYIIITANGGMNQQRVAVCIAVVITRLLDTTLVLPRFTFSSVWRDITDTDIGKESKPGFYVKKLLPILIRNRVVHFFRFGNRLAFDPVPSQLQRLRCRSNFHALRFAPMIQETGSLLLRRMCHHRKPGLLDDHLVGSYAELPMLNEKDNPQSEASRYLSLHLRFEIDMVAHSLCEFGGGEDERKELEAYRELHFPALSQLEKTEKNNLVTAFGTASFVAIQTYNQLCFLAKFSIASRLPSAASLREEGLCPLTPEEAVLILATLVFRRKTHIYVAVADIYGVRWRLNALNTLYPSLVTKETHLSASELEPFKNFSSQLAALNFIVCTAADAFSMTDSGSQLSSLVVEGKCQLYDRTNKGLLTSSLVTTRLSGTSLNRE